jgi:hypothetical protein
MPRQASPAASCRSCRTLAPSGEYQCAASLPALLAEQHHSHCCTFALLLAAAPCTLGRPFSRKLAALARLASTFERLRGLSVLRRPAHRLLASYEGTAVPASTLHRLRSEGSIPNNTNNGRLARSCHNRLSRRPCELVQRRATGSVLEPVSPMLQASARLAAKSIGSSWSGTTPCLRSPGLTLRSSGQPPASRWSPLTSNVMPHLRCYGLT